MYLFHMTIKVLIGSVCPFDAKKGVWVLESCSDQYGSGAWYPVEPAQTGANAFTFQRLRELVVEFAPNCQISHCFHAIVPNEIVVVDNGFVSRIWSTSHTKVVVVQQMVSALGDQNFLLASDVQY